MSGNLNDPAAAASTAGGSAPAQEIAVDLGKLNALSPEVISKQATVSSARKRGSYVEGLRLMLDQHR
jgi:hypothetical protein